MRVTSPTWGPPPPCKQALRVWEELLATTWNYTYIWQLWNWMQCIRFHKEDVAPFEGLRILGSEKVLLVHSEALGIWNPVQLKESRIPLINYWNPESKFYWQRLESSYWIRNPHLSWIRIVESMLACVAWRFWLGALSNKVGRGQRNREEIGAEATWFLFFSRLRRSSARLNKTAMLRRLKACCLWTSSRKRHPVVRF